MKFSASAITAAVFGLLVSSAVAAPAASADSLEKREDCIANAAILSSWSEDGMTRYRIGYSSTKADVGSGYGDSCGLFYNAIDNCAGTKNNVACYHSSSAGQWVIDNNQVSGAAGKSAEECLVQRFRDAFGNKIGCRVN
ncbi:hypothetical protein GTA08_BOTSDO13722 [Neofusicoccum parvum]|uniref:Secreted protein n=2 Tax=Neofusicoccum parvum TaxID=310453 RepID=R1E8Z4_BOTPV|nr:hypothetical protein UCRNP2_9039 [Neofusicoccum parvum UCRNP2]GME48348.1 hypothetical protein GTA08_BOTSDO13722 [Neofusicoccum parvum]GME48580.1 hypothetical protein GTA08_BOTSDO13722 [Neofusicoccum parvum]